MANAKIPRPLGTHSISIDPGTLCRTNMPQPGVIGVMNLASQAEVDHAKRALAMDISQLILDITGIFDPSPISDGTNLLISLARGNWVDAVASAVSIVPYIGDLSKTAKLPRYIKSVRKAIHIATFDAKWADALRTLFTKLKKVLDECIKLAADVLPNSAKTQLKDLKYEVDKFLDPIVGTTNKLSDGGKKADLLPSSNLTRNQRNIDRAKPPKKVYKKSERGYSLNKNDGPKTTLGLSKRHSEISQRISKRIGNSSPVQSSKDLDHLFKQAKVADIELKQLTNDIASSTNGKSVFPPGLKTKARAVEKIKTDYRGDASKLLDISRSSISYESADDLYKALEKIDKKAEIVRIKDRFIKPAPGGYRDILINLKQSNGHVTELQLHSKQILDVKGGTGHKLYEQIRKINGKAAFEGRPLSAGEFKLRNSLVKKSESLYDDAFNSFLGK